MDPYTLRTPDSWHDPQLCRQRCMASCAACINIACACSSAAPLLPALCNECVQLRQNPGILPEILKSLFEIVLFEECTNQVRVDC